MFSQTTIVLNQSGLHARPASLFVRCAMGFTSVVTVRDMTTESDCHDAKSVLAVMGIGIKKGHEIEIAAEGNDEQRAVEALVELIESGCGE